MAPKIKEDMSEDNIEGIVGPKPKRPLSAYNFFFQSERKKMLLTLPTRTEGKPRGSHGKCSFSDMAKIIANKWNDNTIEATEKEHFKLQAREEKLRYKNEMALYRKKVLVYKKSQKRGNDSTASVTESSIISDQSSSSANSNGQSTLPLTGIVQHTPAFASLEPATSAAVLPRVVSYSARNSFCFRTGIQSLASDLGTDGVNMFTELFRNQAFD